MFQKLSGLCGVFFGEVVFLADLVHFPCYCSISLFSQMGQEHFLDSSLSGTA